MVRLKLYREKKEQADGKDSKNVSEELSAAGMVRAPGRGKIFSTVTQWWYSGGGNKKRERISVVFLFKMADRKVLIYLIGKK